MGGDGGRDRSSARGSLPILVRVKNVDVRNLTATWVTTRPSAHDRAGQLLGHPHDVCLDIVRRRHVVLEGLLLAARAGDPRLVDDRLRRHRRGRAPSGGRRSPGRTRPAAAPRSAPASSRTVRTPSSASRAAVRSPMPQIAVTGRSPITSNHCDAGQAGDAARLGEAGRGLGGQPRVADPDRARERGLGEHAGLDVGGQCFGVVGRGADERLVPAPHLDDHVERPQRRHHLGRGRVVGGPIVRQEHGVGALARTPSPAACPTAPRTPGPRTRRSPRPDAAGAGCRRRRRSPAVRPAPVGGGPRPRRGTGRGRRAAPSQRSRQRTG